jgi:hypothetical protein
MPRSAGLAWSAGNDPCYRDAVGLEGNGARPAEAVNPAHIVAVRDFSPETLAAIAAQLEASTDFEHLVYREAELDAIWSITGFFLAQEPDAAERDVVTRLHVGAHRAHDLVGEGRPREAAALLRKFL